MRFRRLAQARARKAACRYPPVIDGSERVSTSYLRKWNRQINLTSLPVEDVGDEAVDRLLIEPLIAAQIPCREADVVDVGSGGGSLPSR